MASPITQANPSDDFTWDPGKRYVFFIEGTWGGATVSVQCSVDGTNYLTLSTDASLTADGGFEFVAPTQHGRVASASAGGTTTLDYTLAEIG